MIVEAFLYQADTFMYTCTNTLRVEAFFGRQRHLHMCIVMEEAFLYLHPYISKVRVEAVLYQAEASTW